METTSSTPFNDQGSTRGGRRTARRRLTGFLAAGVLAGTSLIAGAAPAQAATGVYVSGGTLNVNASTGWVNNNITVSRVWYNWQWQYQVTDANDSINLPGGSGCTRAAWNSVRCPNVSRITVNTYEGNDTVNATTAVHPVTISTGGGNDTARGGAANDNINGGNGTDWLYGRAGNDTMDVGPGVGWANGEAGNDTIWGDTSADTLYGSDGNDTIYAWPGNDYVYGGNGNDRLYGQDGNDRLYGQDGADYVDGGAGADHHFGGNGNDDLYGIDGVAWNDYLNGEADWDRCRADFGDTRISCEWS